MLTEAEISYDEMKRMVKNHTCGKCDSHLNICWGGAHGVDGYILRCALDVTHDGITTHNKKDEINFRRAFSMDSTALTVMSEETMIARVSMAKFPQDLTAPEKKLLAQVAITYGFDPLMGEVTIYQGRPWVSIDGRYRKAQETGLMDGVETGPATKQERIDWEIPDGDFFFRTELWLKGASRPFVGWGRVRKSETIGGKGYKPIETNPQRMAEKRAEAMALRKAFHIPLPSFEDIGSDETEYKATVVEPKQIAEPKVKKEKPAPAQEPAPEPPQEQTEPVEDTPSTDVFTTDTLLDKVAEAKGFTSQKTARSFLIGKCQVADSRINNEPEAVWDEVGTML